MRKSIKKNETPKERFQRLAIPRTNGILKRLKTLGNCANRYMYEYSERDIEKIFSEIKRKVKEVESKFHFSRNKEFKL